MLSFDDFNMLSESMMLESEFAKFAKILSQEDKEPIVKLGPILKEYERVRMDAVKRRAKIVQQVSKETDAEKKQQLNDQLVGVNDQESKKIEQLEKKLVDWAEDKNARMRYLMRSRTAELDGEAKREESKLTDRDMTDQQRKRAKEMQKQSDESMKLRWEKMEKMMSDEQADTKKEDDKIRKSDQRMGDLEMDYDGDGKVTPEEKKARQQRDEQRAKKAIEQI